MKNRIAIGAVVAALFFVCIALNAKVVKYTDFIGVWYHKSDGIQYIFEDGIIKCADNEIILLNNDVFSGAYTFAKNKAAIFVIDDNGVGEIVELHLVRKQKGIVYANARMEMRLFGSAEIERQPLMTLLLTNNYGKLIMQKN